MEIESVGKAVERIATEVSKHTEAFKKLATKKELDDRFNDVLGGQDKTMVILKRLDQERHFTFEAVKRLDNKAQILDIEVKKHREEIGYHGRTLQSES
ncbi:MAG: hypothetical protein NTX71_11015 [Candidatus Aureabacteria bacterium]|nr:hypothetical protein [Candidatus Auribacterota bacterium]